jgi:transcriptional regulator with XRE-family HTH domain
MTQPISVIAKSLVRERLRTGLSLAEIARRAGIANPRFPSWSPATVTLAWKRCGRFAWRWIFLCPPA